MNNVPSRGPPSSRASGAFDVVMAGGYPYSRRANLTGSRTAHPARSRVAGSGRGGPEAVSTARADSAGRIRCPVIRETLLIR
ncbi:hypothetical protein GCM10027605_40400 [Micromonospora zhanjiangensis]